MLVQPHNAPPSQKKNPTAARRQVLLTPRNRNIHAVCRKQLSYYHGFLSGHFVFSNYDSSSATCPQRRSCRYHADVGELSAVFAPNLRPVWTRAQCPERLLLETPGPSCRRSGQRRSGHGDAACTGRGQGGLAHFRSLAARPSFRLRLQAAAYCPENGPSRGPGLTSIWRAWH